MRASLQDFKQANRTLEDLEGVENDKSPLRDKISIELARR